MDSLGFLTAGMKEFLTNFPCVWKLFQSIKFENGFEKIAFVNA